MSEQENIQITRRVFDYFNKHDPDAGEQYLADNFRSEATGAQGQLNKEQNRMYNHRFMDAFPDLHFDVKDVFAQGDHVCATYVVSGTNTKPMAMPNGDSIPATNKKASVPGCTVLEFRGNKVIHQQVYWDQVTLLSQLGLVREQDLMSRAGH